MTKITKRKFIELVELNRRLDKGEIPDATERRKAIISIERFMDDFDFCINQQYPQHKGIIKIIKATYFALWRGGITEETCFKIFELLHWEWGEEQCIE